MGQNQTCMTCNLNKYYKSVCETFVTKKRKVSINIFFSPFIINLHAMVDFRHKKRLLKAHHLKGVSNHRISASYTASQSIASHQNKEQQEASYRNQTRHIHITEEVNEKCDSNQITWKSSSGWPNVLVVHNKIIIANPNKIDFV